MGCFNSYALLKTDMKDKTLLKPATKNIMIVDDEVASAHLLLSVLKGEGYKVRVSINGEGALKTLETKLSDLILLDIRLPGMDGFEVCRQLKSSDRYRNIPVIFLSALNDPVEKVKGFQIGGVDYVTKPFTSEEVLARVKTHLSMHFMQEQLEIWNTQLGGEVVARQKSENALQNAHDELEFLVEKRTMELSEANKALQIEIKEHKQAKEEIRASLREKEVLLKEIHHRVKNNMQLIISLLRLQSEQISDSKHLEMFKDSLDRLRSMALIHERLYMSGDFSTIDFNNYVETFVNEMFRAHGVDSSRIATNMKIENVTLSVDYALPCGLIINELLSNSLKYAFPQGRKGKISIAVCSVNEQEVKLIYSDNGIGLPENIDFENTESLGLYLVRTLAEHQLAAKISLERTDGTKYHIQFKKTGYKRRI